MNLKTITTTFLAASLLITPSVTSAGGPVEGELYYGSIATIGGDSFIAKYQSPSGDLYYKCDLKSFNCKSSPAPTNSSTNSDRAESSDGKYRVDIKRTPGSSLVAYELLEKSGTSYKKIATIPYTLSSESVSFANDDKDVLIDLGGGFQMIYAIKTKKLSEISGSPSSSSNSLTSTSPNGSIMSSYNYSTGYTFTNLSNGKSGSIASNYGSIVEFSSDSKFAAVLTQNTAGLHELKLLNISNLPAIQVISSKLNTGAVVADYLFSNNYLYYISNDKTPMKWRLVRVDQATGKKYTVDEHVSYGDYMKNVKGKLIFLKQNGKVRDIYKVEGNSSPLKTKGTPVSNVDSSLTRKEVTISGSHGALIEPKNSSGKKLPLIVWMHGGPRRQASVDYHPYLSYGVYDDLLEKFAANGARVWKIDYTGSWGYGKSMIDDLRYRFGDIEIDDITSSIEKIKKDYPTTKVYLSGTSYGGYTTLKTIADYPSLIDGGVAINAVTDWQDLINRIPGSPFINEFGGMPGLLDTQGRYDKASVKARFGAIDKDPVAVVYGTKDSTVPPYQSTDFLAFTQGLGLTQVQGVPLAGEEHVIKTRSALNTLCSTQAKVFGFKDSVCK